ncbi:MAG TPA: hypothetical protein VGA03_10510 [Anaerolineales bacterium]
MQNPWGASVLDSLKYNETLLHIGTGQTTIDLLVALNRLGHAGRIIAFSRRGLLPMARAGFEQYPTFFDEIKNLRRILDIFRVVRKHLDRAEAMGIDKRAVIDSLRPDTQTLWLSLPNEEKRWRGNQEFETFGVLQNPKGLLPPFFPRPVGISES